jgi:hypothetical protein
MSRFHSFLRARALTLFGIDVRSLALFRIAIALLLLIDLASRLRLVSANYTDVGAHPRATALLAYGMDGLPSLYMLGGSTRFALALFLVAGVAAVLLGIGWRTRIATLVSWLLLDSLHSRHLLLLDGGDYLLRCLLFWSIFLPLGARWSFDARRLGPARFPFVFSPASAAILLQVGCMFLVTGLTKTGPEWMDGTAIQYAINRKWWILPFGEWLLAHPTLPQLLTPAVRGYEIFGALALFAPLATVPIRLGSMLGFWGMLAGLGLGLRLNLFPWIAGTGLLLFLPAQLWGWLGLRFARLRETAGLPSAPSSRLRRRASAAVQAVVLALLLLMLQTNAGQVKGELQPPKPLRRITALLNMPQGWLMYAPSPRHVDAWYEHRGKLRNRAVVDLDSAAGGSGWRSVERAWHDYRFQFFLQKLAAKKWRKVPAPYAQWLCRQWNQDRSEGERLASVTVTLVVQPLVLPGEPQPQKKYRTLTTAQCPR